MKSKIKGKYGEDLAVSYLETQGFEIIERNYRYRRSEIDVIGLLDNNLLVFFEVKLREKSQFGEPETFVGPNQQEKIIEAAEDYIYAINWEGKIRFDIISITGEEINHLEDCFF